MRISSDANRPQTVCDRIYYIDLPARCLSDLRRLSGHHNLGKDRFGEGSFDNFAAFTCEHSIVDGMEVPGPVETIAAMFVLHGLSSICVIMMMWLSSKASSMCILSEALSL